MNECCDAILEFPDKTFVMCEFDKDHKGNHRALMFEWLGEGTRYASQLDKDAGDSMMRGHIERITGVCLVKKDV